MSVEVIGKQIATLRKEKGIKQEELANYVGVSTQAVSKWENGGVPDTDLLPKIADFFSVPVDTLFGRDIDNYNDLRTSLCKKIVQTPNEDRFNVAFDYCWDIERALYGEIPKDGSIEDYRKNIETQTQIYSSIMSDYGYTRMGIANKLQYFLLVPEIKDTEAALFEDVDYLDFFKDFSDKNLFNACVFLNKRENNKAFTENLFIKRLNITAEEATKIITILEKYNLIYKTQIEMDDEIKTVYNFRPSPSFVALLIFTKDMIKAPNNFNYYSGGRNKPYLK